MKILLITSIYLPHIGGIELYVKNLAANLIAKGHDVSVFVGDRFVKSVSLSSFVLIVTAIICCMYSFIILLVVRTWANRNL